MLNTVVSYGKADLYRKRFLFPECTRTGKGQHKGTKQALFGRKEVFKLGIGIKQQM